MQPVTRTRSFSAVQLGRLREWRERRMLSQHDLAKLTGLSRTTIIQVEHGRNAWPSTVRKLVKALRVKSSDELR